MTKPPFRTIPVWFLIPTGLVVGFVLQRLGVNPLVSIGGAFVVVFIIEAMRYVVWYRRPG